MELVPVSHLPDGQHFIMPWRKKGVQVGRVKYQGANSTMVRIQRHEGDGWEELPWAQAALVVPCSEEEFMRLGNESHGEITRNRSAVESPVKLVHRICDEIAEQGGNRDTMIEACVAEGVNINTAKTQYYKWRKKRKGR